MVTAALSPSRAADFMQCPLLYRFRVVDRLPQAPSSAAARGTLVHAVLERLFDLPADQRTYDAARALLSPQWAELLAAEPELAALFPEDDGVGLQRWLDDAEGLLTTWFAPIRPPGPMATGPAQRVGTDSTEAPRTAGRLPRAVMRKR